MLRARNLSCNQNKTARNWITLAAKLTEKINQTQVIQSQGLYTISFILIFILLFIYSVTSKFNVMYINWKDKVMTWWQHNLAHWLYNMLRITVVTNKQRFNLHKYRTTNPLIRQSIRITITHLYPWSLCIKKIMAGVIHWLCNLLIFWGTNDYSQKLDFTIRTQK